MLSIQYVRDGVCEKGSESGTRAYVTEEATERESDSTRRSRAEHVQGGVPCCFLGQQGKG